jgi:hypothetical protein
LVSPDRANRSQCRQWTLFLLDETHDLDAASLAAVCMAFQAVSDVLPAALAGVGVPDLKVLLMRAKPYADRLFEYRELGRLRDPEARMALIKPAAILGVDFAAGAADDADALGSPLPVLLEECGRVLWDAEEPSPISRPDVDEVRELVQERLARMFCGTQLATDAEQRCLAVTASLGPPLYARRCCARVEGAELAPDVPARDSLMQNGLVWSPRKGFVHFTVPLFAELLLEHHPIGGFHDE